MRDLLLRIAIALEKLVEIQDRIAKDHDRIECHLKSWRDVR